MEAVLAVGRDFELLAGLNLLPDLFAGEQNFAVTVGDVHDFHVAGTKFVGAGQEDAEGFALAAGEIDRVAGDFAVEVDVGLCDSRYVFELFNHAARPPVIFWMDRDI